MHKVVERTRIVPNIHLLRLEAPEVVRRVVAGNFVIVKIDEVADVYGVIVPPNAEGLTLAQYLDREFHERCVVGDRKSVV